MEELSIGDVVKIIREGQMFPTYRPWFDINNSKYKSYWVYNDIKTKGKEFIVVEKDLNHQRKEEILYLIQCTETKQVYLFGRKGLELVNKVVKDKEKSYYAAEYRRYLDCIVKKDMNSIYTDDLSKDINIPKEKLDSIVIDLIEYAELKYIRKTVLNDYEEVSYYEAVLCYYNNDYIRIATSVGCSCETIYAIFKLSDFEENKCIYWADFATWVNNKYAIKDIMLNEINSRFESIL